MVRSRPSYRFGEIPITQYLRRWAALAPVRPAYVFYGREIGYAELDALSDRLAVWLEGRGVRKGDRVAVLLPTCPQVAIAFYGILKLGAVYVPINPMLKPPEIAMILEDSGARGIVALDALVPTVADMAALDVRLATSLGDMLPERPTIPVSDKIRFDRHATPGFEDLLAILAEPAAKDADYEVALDDMACIIYSGGTTGMPKGCEHSHLGLIYTGACTVEYGWDIAPGDRMVLFAPTFWVAGQLITLLGTIVAGATTIMLTRWHADGVLAAIDHYRATHVYMFVDSAEEIMERPDFGSYDLGSLKHTIVSSQLKQLNADVRARWRAATGSVMREAGYGLTETHTADASTLGFQDDDEDLKAEPIFCGRPVPGTEVRILDFETGETLPAGERGEICIRSPSVLRGYWGNPEATRSTIIDGWLHTGDIGKLDERGLLHYLGRRKEMMKVRGMSVFPAEIERVLLIHPAVSLCGVVSRKDGRLGEVPVAFVLPKPEALRDGLEGDLRDWCRDRLAAYKVPEIRLATSLPLTETSKVRRVELARLVAGEESLAPQERTTAEENGHMRDV